MKSLLVILSLSISSLTHPQSVSAQKPFNTSFKTHYQINDDATTLVIQQITLTNLTSSTYASQYAIEVGSSEISNITAETQTGQEIPINLGTTDNSTVIRLTFPKETVGKNQQFTFFVSYQNPNISSKNGQVLEINIPKLNFDDQIDEYTTTVTTPSSLSSPSIISPQPLAQQSKDLTTTWTFSKQHRESQGIKLIFGEHQSLNFTLSYHLSNDSVNNGITQIALPPDTAYQKLYYSLIEPPPIELTPDPNGNWIATYQLNPKQTLDILVQGKVQLFPKPTVNTPNPSNLNLFLSSQQPWPTKDSQIKTLVSQLQSPSSIYNYITDNFSHAPPRQSSPQTRPPASQLIANSGKTTAQGFVDIFITLARASGIPSRQLTGFALSEHSNRPVSTLPGILHTWAEYYDSHKNQWISVDPTWGSTTNGADYFNSFDLNHFVFSIQGTHPDKPLAPGQYASNNSSADVLINISSASPSAQNQLDFKTKLSPLNIFGLSANARITISNKAGTAAYNIPTQFSATDYHIKKSPNTLPYLLPFSQTEIKLKLQPHKPFQKYPSTLLISTPNKTYEQTLNQDYQQQLLFVLGLGAAIIAVSTISWRVLVRFQKK